MKKTLIQLIKAAASKLHDSKLKRLGGKEMTLALERVVQALSLEGKEEAIIFIALFDKSCAGRSCDLEDMASYFGCSQLDIMEYVSALKSLVKKGLVVQTDLSECRLARQDFMASNYAISCILENKKPEFREAQILEKEFGRYDFCKLVNDQIQDGNVTAEALFQFIEQTEEENMAMPLVKDLRTIIPSLPARALFYEVCYDFFTHNGDSCFGFGHTLMEILREIYEAYGVRFKERKILLDGTHPLIQADLVEISGDKENILLTVAGQQLFLGEDFGAFGKQYSGLNRYSFAREVKEYVHSKEHDVENPKAKERLSLKICQVENSNRNIACLQKVRDILSEEDFRALFYIICDACANGDVISISRELNELYPVKERNINSKLFKDEMHKMQKLDLVEMVTETSFFGEYAVLRLTDEGKELYFEEDARLFIEKVNKKELIVSTDIKEKRLFFSEKEQEQLQLVGDVLQEQNYRSLVGRLESKGFSKGIAILLYGAPGTGKTESVMQWARQSGRDVVHVDISASKSMWYGESEKIVKDIFTRYKRMCKRTPVKPILLFNEADAIFSKRRNMDDGRSTDQTENTIQNIILEEMEKLDGILIATTNLADNLDKAFERRFLFKIRFERPTVEAKRNIWMDKLPGLTTNEAACLAADYDFSGGEIDNIVRKATMMEVIDGIYPSINVIHRFCKEEKITKPYAKIGFSR